MAFYKTISHDGEDKNGVRAEVKVSVGNGKINSIEESNNGQAARVEIVPAHPKLKRNVGGWVRTDDPLYAIAKDAFDNGVPVEYRFETQRKKNIDRSIPFEDIVNVTDDLVSILANINGTFSQEAVTDPAEDDAPDGARLNAREQNAQRKTEGAQPSSTTTTTTTTTTSSAPVEHRGSSSAVEERPWERFNSDGRPNVGSYELTGNVSAEALARKHLVETGKIKVEEFLTDSVEKQVALLTRGLLNAADAIQVAPDHVRAGNARPNRMSVSHTRARGIVYDSLQYVPFDAENPREWYENILALSKHRILFAVSLVDGVTGDVRRQEPVEEPVNDTAPPSESWEYFMPSKEDLEGERATAETVSLFIEMFNESSLTDAKELTPLIVQTFGVRRIKETSEEALAGFLDYYVEQDDDLATFVAAAEAAKKMGARG